MAFAGGVFSRLYSWVADAQAGNPISPVKFDADMNDMAAGLSLAILRNGTGVPTSDISWNGKRITNLAVPNTPGDALSLGNTPQSEIIRALSFTPVQQGGGVGQLSNAIKIGFDGTGPKITVDSTDFGYLWVGASRAKTVVSGNSGYRLFPDGSLTQFGVATVTGDQAIPFPVSFPTACRSVVAVIGAGVASSQLWAALVDGVGQGSFVVRPRYLNSGSSTINGASAGASPNVYWIAEGN